MRLNPAWCSSFHSWFLQIYSKGWHSFFIWRSGSSSEASLSGAALEKAQCPERRQCHWPLGPSRLLWLLRPVSESGVPCALKHWLPYCGQAWWLWPGSATNTGVGQNWCLTLLVGLTEQKTGLCWTPVGQGMWKPLDTESLAPIAVCERPSATPAPVDCRASSPLRMEGAHTHQKAVTFRETDSEMVTPYYESSPLILEFIMIRLSWASCSISLEHSRGAMPRELG